MKGFRFRKISNVALLFMSIILMGFSFCAVAQAVYEAVVDKFWIFWFVAVILLIPFLIFAAMAVSCILGSKDVWAEVNRYGKKELLKHIETNTLKVLNWSWEGVICFTDKLIVSQGERS